VIVAVDGTVTSEAIIGRAAAWAASLRLPIELVNVVEAGVTCPPDVLDGSYVVGLATHLGEGPVGFDVLHGDPADAIVRHARDDDLIALTSRARGGLMRTALGSVAMRIVHRAPCPVLVGSPVSTAVEEALA
jgi:nucleotide-binding universal stress UspA family protein